MRAICTTAERELELREVPTPEKPAPQHLIIEMAGSGINPGDISFLKAVTPRKVATSLYDVWGVSGAGIVIATGDDVPANYLGKKVAIYRSLVSTSTTIGCWSDVAQMHYLSCVILPDTVDCLDYAASLVNVITPYTFLKQIQQENHQGILVTAGSSATGIAMLGIAISYNIPIVSIVRSREAEKRLRALGAENVLVRTDVDFSQDLAAMAEAYRTTAVFEGVGAVGINDILPSLAYGSTVYSYGHLGGDAPLSVPASTLMARKLSIKGFSNFGSATVQDRKSLEKALEDIEALIEQPHFRTTPGKLFAFEDIQNAMNFSIRQKGKAILIS